MGLPATNIQILLDLQRPAYSSYQDIHGHLAMFTIADLIKPNTSSSFLRANEGRFFNSFSVILSVRNIRNTTLTAPEDPVSFSISGFRYAVENYFCRCLSDLKYCDFLLSPLLFSLISPLKAFKQSWQKP